MKKTNQFMISIRRTSLWLVFAANFGFVLCHAGEPANGTPSTGWKLIWHDEFEGSAVDNTKWGYDIGNGFYAYDASQWISGWGNDELEYYTREADNVFVKDGQIHIRAMKESLLGCGYTSARLKTRGKDGAALFSKKFGKFEFRAKLPTGKGIWPAIWMMPQEGKYGTWASSGEIDIMEARGQEPTRVLSTLHFGSCWPVNTHVSKEYLLPETNTIAGFHIYAIEWDPGEIRWSVDGQQYATQSFWWSSSKMDDAKGAVPASETDLNPWPAPFDQTFYLIMNVAVGGKFLGNPDAATVFPAEMIVDYVRVYDRTGGYGLSKARGLGELPF